MNAYETARVWVALLLLVGASVGIGTKLDDVTDGFRAGYHQQPLD